MNVRALSEPIPFKWDCKDHIVFVPKRRRFSGRRADNWVKVRHYIREQEAADGNNGSF